MTSSARPTTLLGIPLGDFGLFATLLLSLASGFLAFFASCFLAIIGLLFWNTLGHHHVNYADAYRCVALPAGLVVLASAFVFLTGAWLRRKFAGAAG